MSTKGKLFTRQSIAWAMYDWGNSAFALSVLAVLFPVFLGSYWSAGDSGPAVTSRLAIATAAGSLIVSVLAPVLGAIADRGGLRKRLLLVFTLLGATGTILLSVVGTGQWPLALMLFVSASIGYYCAAIFYDSLLVDVSEPKFYSLISSFGLSLGYIGGAILLTLHVWLIANPQVVGFDSAASVVKFAFASVGFWWLIFLLPIMLVVKERRSNVVAAGSVIVAAYSSLRETFRKIKTYRNIYLFLIAYWLYIGGLFTVVFMAVNFGQRLGFSDTDLITALMITNYVGFPATIAFGMLAHRFGEKHAIYVGLLVYIAVVCFAVFLTDVRQFYVMAIIIGLVQGGVQSISRSLYAALIPPDQSGEFFGFYNMLTKFSHMLGPLMIAAVGLFTDEPKYMLFTLMPLFVIGALLLGRVEVAPKGQEARPLQN